MAKCGRCRRLTWALVQLSAFTVHNVTNPSRKLSVKRRYIQTARWMMSRGKR
jgi:hypothetical protein